MTVSLTWGGGRGEEGGGRGEGGGGKSGRSKGTHTYTSIKQKVLEHWSALAHSPVQWNLTYPVVKVPGASVYRAGVIASWPFYYYVR